VLEKELEFQIQEAACPPISIPGKVTTLTFQILEVYNVPNWATFTPEAVHNNYTTLTRLQWISAHFDRSQFWADLFRYKAQVDSFLANSVLVQYVTRGVWVFVVGFAAMCACTGEPILLWSYPGAFCSSIKLQSGHQIRLLQYEFA